MLRIASAAALAAAILLCGCHQHGGLHGERASTSIPSTGAQGVSPADDIRAELASQNFGHAAELAAAASGANPGNPELHLLEARANGYLGKAPEAVAALQKAVLAGLPAPRSAIADPAFDRIRDTAVFRDALRRLMVVPRRPGADDAIGAGDIKIREVGGRETVSAGDLSLDTGN